MIDENTGLPLIPSVGDGRLWDGKRWLHVAPSMAEHAFLSLLNVVTKYVAEPTDENKAMLDDFIKSVWGTI